MDLYGKHPIPLVRAIEKVGFIGPVWQASNTTCQGDRKGWIYWTCMARTIKLNMLNYGKNNFIVLSYSFSMADWFGSTDVLQ